MTETSQSKWVFRAWLAGLLLAAVAVRWFGMPARYRLDDLDDFYYLMGGPAVWEGLPPPMHYTFAGPQTWVAWAYTGATTARYVLAPTAEESAVPFQVRAYVATDHATWDLYHDMSGLRLLYLGLSAATSVAAVAAAFAYGRRRGGLPGAVLTGGLAALLPVIVTHCGMAKPYAAGWACVLIAASLAAGAATSRRRAWWSAAFMGLAAASRVELLAVAPLIVLAELWPARASVRGFAAAAVRYVLVMTAALLLAAPWALTNLMGNLRAIATIRFGPAPVPVPLGRAVAEFVWDGAIGLPAAVVLAGVALAALRRPAARAAGWSWPAAAFGLLLMTSFLKPTGYGLRHQGPAFMAVLLLAAPAAGVVAAASRRAAWAVAAAALAVAGFQSAVQVRDFQAAYVPDEATAWVESNVPAGSVVYVSPTLRDPLPTPASADAIWDEVTARDAVRRKYEQGAARLNLGRVDPPRAMGEQLMVTERASARRFYVLGGRAGRVGPRFDVRRYYSSVVFGLQDPVPEFLRTGGTLVWRGGGPPPGLDVTPTQTWVNAAGTGTYVYVNPPATTRPGTQPTTRPASGPAAP